MPVLKRPALRILLDQNSPLGLQRVLIGHEVSHTFTLGWDNFENANLIAVAEAAGFEVMVTADQNIQYQHNLTNRRLALIVLSTTNWGVIRGKAAAVVAAVNAAVPGSCAFVQFERSRLRRRPKPARGIQPGCQSARSESASCQNEAGGLMETVLRPPHDGRATFTNGRIF